MNMGISEQNEDYGATVKEAVFQEETFLRLTLSGKVRGKDVPWVKIVVRPVLVKGRRQIQFTYFDGKKDTTENLFGAEFRERLDKVLSIPFRQLHVQSTSSDLHVRITKKGKVLIKRGKPSRREQQPLLSHNRVKRYPLPVDTPDDFLQAIGIMDRSGRVRSTMQRKFRQINEFLRLMQQVVRLEDLTEGIVDIVDCGCGSAHLTFAAYHYLNHIQGISAYVVGIDSNEEIIKKCRKLRDSMVWDRLEFRVSRIAEFSPRRPPDVVLSLHACDTATDEAIAQGILWKSKVILVAPCCQHELYSQLRAPLFQPVLRHGILKQRTADILTDAFRALILRIMGYRTDVVEFVSPEHTSKNLMIRAKKAIKPGDKTLVQQYNDLKNFWEVELCIERLLGDEIGQFLDVCLDR